MKWIYFFCLLALVHVQADPQADTLKQQVLVELPKIAGWCSLEKASHFIDLIIETQPKVCVEIGVFAGSSLFPVASALRFLGEGIVIGIDPWDQWECIKYFTSKMDDVHLKWWMHVDLESIYHSYCAMLKKFSLENYCLTIRATSEMAVSQIPSIDILYIDGNHSELSYVQDVQLYLPKVNPGGYIWINDTLNINAQVALECLMKQCDFIKTIDKGNCILFKKRMKRYE